MGRKRDLSPNFFTNEELAEADAGSGLLRLAYEGLWTVADREGRFEWKPSRLKLAILPYDQVNFAELMDRLEQGGWLVSYVVDDRRYGWIPSFGRHQTIHPREAASKFPPPPLHVSPLAGSGTPKDDNGQPKDDEGSPETGQGAAEVGQGKEKSTGVSGPSGPSEYQDLQDLQATAAAAGLPDRRTMEALVRAVLPPVSHEALDRILRSTGNPEGVINHLARSLAVHPKLIPTGPNGKGRDPEQLATALVEFANGDRPRWNAAYFDGCCNRVITRTAEPRRTPEPAIAGTAPARARRLDA